jgi:hypothetical protein
VFNNHSPANIHLSNDTVTSQPPAAAGSGGAPPAPLPSCTTSSATLYAPDALLQKYVYDAFGDAV